MSPRPILDYVARLDERNLAHRVTAAPDLTHVSRYWTPGVVLDQGQEGSCVGHGVVGEYLASPVRGKVAGPIAGHVLAEDVYDEAKEIDEWEGVDYDGTSVRAGMLVARERGWCSGFKWALSMPELRAALEQGPIVIGFDVRESMFDTESNGDWLPSGPSVGGHCAIITGYSPNLGRRGPRYRIRNSWGADWGAKGSAYIDPLMLNEILFRSGGEAAVAIGRHL